MKQEQMQQYWTGTNLVLDTVWGDCGKGKFVDLASQYSDLIIRWAGGSNAGHTVVNEYGTFKQRLMPSGIFEAQCILADTVALDPMILMKEMLDLEQRGFEIGPENLLISLDAHLTMPWHKLRDGMQDAGGSTENIGTTKSGNGPVYADRALRRGLQMWHLFEPDLEDRFMRELIFQDRVVRQMAGERFIGEIATADDLRYLNKRQLMQLARQASSSQYIDADATLEGLYAARERFKPLATEVIPVIHQAVEQGRPIGGEGNQGTLLWLEGGTYPYVSSSDPTATGFTAATHIREGEMNHILGMTRAYTARVGEGPMPTERLDDVGNHIRQVGNEFGTNTGRARRVGDFDAVAVAYGAQISGSNEMAVTKIDVLDDLDRLRICVGYEINGHYFPAGKLPHMKNRFVKDAIPVYEEMDGWQQSTKQARTFEDLPPQAQEYIHRIEKLVDKPVTFVSVGGHRDATIYREQEVVYI